MSTLLIAIPACNEALPLEHFLPRLQGIVKKLDFKTTILVVDDGSTDNTAQVVAKYGCKLLRNDGNRGLGYSLRKAYQTVEDEEYDFLVTMDSDGQHDPGLLPHALASLQKGYDLITCSRYHPDSERFSPPLDRDLLNIAVTSMMYAVTGWHHLTDPLTGFWCMNNHIASFLAHELKLERYGTCLEALIKMWYLLDPKPKLAEIPHPAIYANNGSGYLNRVYSPAQMEDRIDRFGTHAKHILAALFDVQSVGHDEAIQMAIAEWRKQLVQ